MIKAKMVSENEGETQTSIVLGLCHENLARLKRDQPIVINLSDLGIENM